MEVVVVVVMLVVVVAMMGDWILTGEAVDLDGMRLNDTCIDIRYIVRMHDRVRSFSNDPNRSDVPISNFPCTYTVRSLGRCHWLRLLLLLRRNKYDNIFVPWVVLLVVNVYHSRCIPGSQWCWMATWHCWYLPALRSSFRGAVPKSDHSQFSRFRSLKLDSFLHQVT